MKIYEKYVALILNNSEIDTILDFKYFLKALKDQMIRHEINPIIAGIDIAEIDRMTKNIDIMFDAAELEVD